MPESSSDSSESYLIALTQRVGILPLIFGLVGILISTFGIGTLVRSSHLEQEQAAFVIDEASASAELSSVVVDVQGAVEKPGVVDLPSGARIQEALAAAGGLSKDADHEYVGKIVNQAAKVSDGMKIYIPFQGEPSSSPLSGASAGKQGINAVTVLGSQTNVVNINTGSLSELDTLDGVGEKTAQKIIAGRPYQRSEELVEKKIVGQAVWGKIKDMVSVY